MVEAGKHFNQADLPSSGGPLCVDGDSFVADARIVGDASTRADGRVVGDASTRADAPTIGRFAPSPTGRMHAGNIFSSLVSWLIAKSSGGKMVLRIEDLDRDRSKPEYIDLVQRDYEKLGLTWDEGPFFQNNRDDAYERAFELLKGRGLVYPCFCTRAELHASSAPHPGEKLVYAGTCRNLTESEQAERSKLRKPAQRLVVPEKTYAFADLLQGEYKLDLARECGDFLVKRSDGAFAYQLAVVVDDFAQGVNCVARGVDLINSTPQQMYLQDLIGAPHPEYAHVPLLVSKLNRRLSKRDHDASIDSLMGAYGSAAGVLGHIAYVAGMIEFDEPASAEELLDAFDIERLRERWQGCIQIVWR